MTRPISSVHAPNIGHLSNRDELLALARGGIVGLDIWFRDTIDGGPTVYEWLRAHLGSEAVLSIRMYPEAGQTWGYDHHWCDQPPEYWAVECVRRLQTLPGVLSDSNAVIFPMNEPDLAIEGYDAMVAPSIAAYQFVWNYQLRWAREMQQLLPTAAIRYGTAPLAGGHEPLGYPPDWEYAMPEAAAAIAAFDVLNLHQYIPREADASGLYWHEDHEGYWHGLRPLRPAGYRQDVQGYPPDSGLRDPGGAMVQYPSKPVLMSEWGNWHHNDPAYADLTLAEYHYCYARYSATGRVVLICPFIWDSGDEHQDNRLRDNWNLIHGLQQIDSLAADLGVAVTWDRHYAWDTAQKALGGQGANNADAFGQAIERGLVYGVGVFTGPYRGHYYDDDTSPYIWVTTTNGVLYVPAADIRAKTVRFATREADLPEV